MKIFKVFKHPVLGYRAVKVGFSWPGFLFPAIWLLIKKLWWQALIVISSVILLTSIEIYFDNPETSVMVLILEFGVYILVGVNGNEWCGANLQAHGFELLDTLQAKTPHAAIGKIAQE
jgi:Protein of unknown function (DUF2628)